MKYIFIRPIVVYSWGGKCVLGHTNSFSGLKESSKNTQMLICCFPSVLMDILKDITVPCQPILAAVLKPCSWNHSKRGLLAGVGAPAAMEMCDRAKPSQPCSEKQTRLGVSRRRGCVGEVKRCVHPQACALGAANVSCPSGRRP